MSAVLDLNRLRMIASSIETLQRISATISSRRDTVDLELEEYIRLAGRPGSIKDTLGFWKAHEGQLQKLANVAKKYLGILASQASVERVFSVSGNVFSVKRRSMSAGLLQDLT